MMEPLYKNLSIVQDKNPDSKDIIIKRKYEHEAAYLKETHINNSNQNENKNSKNHPKMKISVDKKKIFEVKNRFKEREFLYDTSLIYNKKTTYTNKIYQNSKNNNSPTISGQNNNIKQKINENTLNLTKPSKYDINIPTAKNDNLFNYDFSQSIENDQSSNNNVRVNNEFNYYSNNKNSDNISSENIKVNILRNLDEKIKLNYDKQNNDPVNVPSQSPSFTNFSKNENIRNSPSKLSKDLDVHNQNGHNILNSSNNNLNTSYSRARSINPRSIRRINTFVSIESGLFKLKNEKSLEKKNRLLNDKENEMIFNKSLNVSKFQRIVDDLKGNTLSELSYAIETLKRKKEDFEYNIEKLTNELNEKKSELNKTKKFNLSYSVDNQNMSMIQNETFRENNFMSLQIPNLINEYNEIKNEMDNHFGETDELNIEINKEKYEIEILQNDIRALKTEINNTNENNVLLRYSIVKQKKENELLKKDITKQEIRNQKYVQEVEILAEQTKKFTKRITKCLSLNN